MRRIVLEIPRDDLARFEGIPQVNAIESFRVVHQFRFDRSKVAGICEVKFRSDRLSPARLEGHAGITKVESLSRLDDGSFLAYFEGKLNAAWGRLVSSTGGHLHPPFELTPEAWRICVLGDSHQHDRFLSKLRSLRIHYSVRKVGRADFGARSPLSVLTRRQTEAISTAYRLGYYAVPRLSDSVAVARSLRLSKSTTVEHLRKAEKRLLDALFDS